MSTFCPSLPLVRIMVGRCLPESSGRKNHTGSGVCPYGTSDVTGAGSDSSQNVSQAPRPDLYSCSSPAGASEPSTKNSAWA
ncbi:hypothetical protein [Streptomyces sp. NBC_00378]|uniref:hypothetical protein n=1 Tax=unclassified Streptomyces TaxID=2593676 RepID=UPI00338D73FA